MKGIDANFSRKLAAVLAASAEVASRPHWSRLGIFFKLIAQRRMRRAKSLRDQELDSLSDEFSPRITEKLLGLRIDEYNGASLIDNDHAVRRCFK